MTSFRRLPPVLRVVSLFRPLLPLGLFVAFMLMVTAGAWPSGYTGAYLSRAAVIAVNLGVVRLACTLVVHVYNSRFRQTGVGPFPLASWQSQARTTLALAAIPTCALALAVLIPPTARAFQFVFPVSIIGALVCLVVGLSIGVGYEAGT